MYKKYNKGLLTKYVNNEIHLLLDDQKVLIFDVSSILIESKKFINNNINKTIVIEVKPKWFLSKGAVEVLNFYTIASWNNNAFSLFCQAMNKYIWSSDFYIELSHLIIMIKT
ncbi:hypothetical protein [Spiroplasma turonicum]|uniref:Uncharacterized protein n=1 Tax=Spiroplasma turonicum TaxID=216946 RepID=A0A0K1P6B8_9MOLU|nr:hypothetical protein [Spiroplasma turonicum]AKU79851.1 hypothetical protein STURON_00605 [Spiroplasma turonicum]ALX70868.1 hypothetical protein STURO_v1c06030 [Spiroplasma turonicum]